MAVRLFIVRHGNTFEPGETVTRVGARTDLALAAKGREQARALGRALKAEGVRPALVWCAPLQRTLETARLALEALGEGGDADAPPFEIRPELTEIDYGPDENQPEASVRARLGEGALAAWDERAVPPPGWLVDPAALTETWRSLFAEAAARLGAAGGDVLVMTSNGVGRFALWAAERSGPAADADIKLATGAFGEIALGEAGRPARVVRWNVRPAL